MKNLFEVTLYLSEEQAIAISDIAMFAKCKFHDVIKDSIDRTIIENREHLGPKASAELSSYFQALKEKKVKWKIVGPEEIK